MDQQKKWLENENYIRFAGAMLMLSPFMNFLVSMWLNPSVNVNWTINEFIVIFMSVSALNWIGRIASFVVGFLMLRGKNTAWTPVLFILAFMIVKNFLTFKADFQISSMQALGNLGINLFLFYLVYQSSEASYEKKRTPKVSPYKRFLIKNNKYLQHHPIE